MSDRLLLLLSTAAKLLVTACSLSISPHMLMNGAISCRSCPYPSAFPKPLTLRSRRSRGAEHSPVALTFRSLLSRASTQPTRVVKRDRPTVAKREIFGSAATITAFEWERLNFGRPKSISTMRFRDSERRKFSIAIGFEERGELKKETNAMKPSGVSVPIARHMSVRASKYEQIDQRARSTDSRRTIDTCG